MTSDGKGGFVQKNFVLEDKVESYVFLQYRKLQEECLKKIENKCKIPEILLYLWCNVFLWK